MRKNIVVGVCGSIAAYKSAEVVRELVKKGWNVKVVMTAAAKEFITPLTLETLSGNPVYSGMFHESRFEEGHIALADFADILLVAPATANIIGKMASGICDDLLSCTVCAFSGKVVFAPAMNCNMWENRIVAANVKKLKEAGYKFVGPEKGLLASGQEGMGRLASPEKIAAFIDGER